MSKGKIITIEGTDGTGKATQKKRLVERLEAEGIPAYSATFPDYESKWGQKIQLHKRGQLQGLGVEHICLLYARDREDKQEQFKQLLEQGTNIILERYIESNLAYQGSKLKGKKRKQMMDWIWTLETNVLEIKPSDYVVLLDLPIKYAADAISKRKLETGDKRKDIYDDNLKLQKEVYNTYKLLAKQPNWTTVPCVKKGLFTSRRYTEDELAEIIWKVIKNILAKS